MLCVAAPSSQRFSTRSAQWSDPRSNLLTLAIMLPSQSGAFQNEEGICSAR